MNSLIIAVLGLVGIVAAVILVARHRGRHIAALAERGIPATARISRRIGRTKVKRIGFVYAGPDGRQYERFASVTRGRYGDLAEGESLPIVLLPDDPGTSAPAWLVDAVREAVEKRRT
jgi:hypothetical protein